MVPTAEAIWHRSHWRRSKSLSSLGQERRIVFLFFGLERLRTFHGHKAFDQGIGFLITELKRRHTRV